MTAFNNIKTNNWPATSNDLEDFLVLKLPLNDQAALTTSPAIVAGSKVLYPKRTLTNTGVSSLSTQGRLWSSTLDTTNTNDLPFRANDIQAAFGTTSAQVETATNGVGRIIWLDFAGNGGAITGSTLKVLGAGASTSLRDIYLNNASTKSGQLDDLINITGTIINSIQIKSNASNAGALLAGIELDGVRLVNPPGGAKKHYDNNARWGASSVNYISTDALKGVSVNQPWTCEFYWLKEGTQHGNHGHFLLNPNNQSLGYREAPATGTSTNDFYCDIGGTSAVGMITSTIATGVWNHFAFVHEGGGTLKTYLNGQLETTKTIGTTGTFADATSIGGGVGSYTAQGVKGFIQDYRIYLTAKYTANFTPPPAILG